MNEQKKIIITTFLSLAIGLTFIFFFIYAASQQIIRLGANEPQIQIVEDAAATMARGEEPAFLKSDVYGKVDITKSLAPFLITFDSNGSPIISTAVLNGATPIPPKGVFEYAKKNGQNRITWAPQKGIRLAAVMVHYGGSREGYALSGRSLSEAESRIDSIGKLLGAGWLVGLFGVLGYALLMNRRKTEAPTG